MAQPAYVLNKDRLAVLMARNGFKTVQEFLDASKLPRSTYYGIEAGQREITGRTLRSILDTFPGTSFEYLFTPSESLPVAA